MGVRAYIRKPITPEILEMLLKWRHGGDYDAKWTAGKLKKVCSDVFEQLAFMFGDEIEKDEIESDAETFLRASMTFQDIFRGT